MVPSGGDLHIVRADFADAVEPYSCRVRNTLSGKEELSAPYTLVINGNKLVVVAVSSSSSSK